MVRRLRGAIGDSDDARRSRAGGARARSDDAAVEALGKRVEKMAVGGGEPGKISKGQAKKDAAKAAKKAAKEANKSNDGGGKKPTSG